MAEFNIPNVGRKADYTIVSIEETSTQNGYLLSVANDSGRTQFSRVYIPAADREKFAVGKTITLVPWSMKIIPIKCDRNGELKTYRTLQGFGWDAADAEAAAIRNAQNMYDQASQVGMNKETLTLANKDACFIDFVDKDRFLEIMESGEY